MENNKKSKNNLICDVLIAIIPIIAVAVIVGIFFDFYYDLNDDSTIRNILSGAFTGKPSAMTVYVYYPLAFGISFLYRIVPFVPWFGMLETVAVFGSIAYISYLFVKKNEKICFKILSSLLIIVIFGVLIFYQMIFVQYTVVAGIMAMTGAVAWFLTDDADTKKFWIKNIPSVVLEVLAFNLRPNMMLLLLPMIGIVYITKWIKEINDKYTEAEAKKRLFSKSVLIKYFTPLALVLVLMGISFAINKAAYSSAEWKEYQRLNDSRTEVMDFQYYVPDYENNSEIYTLLGLTENEAAILGFENYNFSLDEKITAETYEKIAEYNKDRLGIGVINAASLKKALSDYKYSVFHTDGCRYSHVIIALYLLLGVVCILVKKYKMLIFEGALVAGRSIGWIYLLINGRIRERVVVPLCLAEIVFLVMMIGVLVTSEKKQVLMGISYAIIAAAVIACFPTNYKNTVNEYEKREKINSSWTELTDCFYERPTDYFILDTMSTVDYSEKIFTANEGRYKNYEIAGGWIVNNPIYEQKLSNANVRDALDDLVNGESVYFVVKEERDIAWLVGFLKECGYSDIETKKDELTKDFSIIKIFPKCENKCD